MLARAVLLLAGITLSLPALAVDVDLAVNTSSEYDTNVSRSDGKKEGDFSFRIGPTVQVHDEIRKLHYQVRYSPIYQKFVREDQFDKLSHFAGGNLDYRIGDKTGISLTENFRFTQSINQEDPGTVGADIESPSTETRRGDIYSNIARLEAHHSFTPRVSGQSILTYEYFDSSNDNTAKNTSLAGLTSLSYAVSARDRIGGGGGVTRQQFDRVPGQPASETLTYRIFASWLHNFGQNTELSLRGGPALISTNQDKPNSIRPLLELDPAAKNPGRTKDTSVTFFGEASLSHDWTQTLSSFLSYNRTDGSASSLGSSTVADSVTFLTNWDPIRKLDITLRGDWVQRKSANDITQASRSGLDTTDRAVDTTYYSASARAGYRASQRITLSARLTYQKQDNNGASVSNTSDFGDFIAFLGFRYEFDPFHF